MTKPAIYMDSDSGVHNADLEKTRDRLIKGDTYRDCSTVCIIPTRGVIPARVVQSWLSLFSPMNQKFTRIIVEGMEVGEAYSSAIENVLAHPDLSKWRYILTLEEDNLPPPDGLLHLIEDMNTLPKEFAAVSGLYFCKGPAGAPMAYGNPAEDPMVNFIPWLPPADCVSEVHGIGCGFALWRMEFFKDERLGKPIFETVQRYQPGVGGQAYTQDLHLCERARKIGWKFAVSTRCLVGHWDQENQQAW